MAQNTLSATARAVLRVAQLHASAPLREIARQARVPVHTAQYWLNRLIDRGVIRRGVVVNPARIGDSRYGCFFSVAPQNIKHKAKLFKFLSLHERVIWYAELGAEYQFGATLIAPSTVELQRFLAEMESNTGMTITRKTISLLNDFTLLEKTYLLGTRESKPRGKLEIVAPTARVEVDDLDRRILSVVNQCSSHLEISRKTGIARQTIDHRVQKLRSQGIILGDVFYISAAQLGYQVFRVLVTLSSQQNSTWQRFANLCEKQPNIVNYSRCVGSWDGEIVIESRDGAHVAELVSELASKLADDVLDLKIVPILAQKTSIRTMGKELPV